MSSSTQKYINILFLQEDIWLYNFDIDFGMFLLF